jgi:hypothetical protein
MFFGDVTQPPIISKQIPPFITNIDIDIFQNKTSPSIPRDQTRLWILKSTPIE